ncbi:MAG: hypothetical protein IKJ16_04600, partial [Agathobacter sp.]|nr:hypothetical protein [Agathobacter sp.]
EVTATADTEIGIRLYDWMGEEVKITLNGEAVEYVAEDGVAVVKAKVDDVVVLEHAIETVTKPEIVRGEEYQIVWRGCDVVDILPHGDHQRLYQRNLDVPFEEPSPEDVVFTGASNYGPTQQKR